MKHILIVDNDAVFTTTVSSILKKEDFDVTIATDGKQAAEKLTGTHYDLVITDVLIPYNNGLEIVNKVRTDESNRHTPVMVVSNVTNEQSVSSWFKQGIDAYLKKPLDLRTLLSGIKQLVFHEKYVAA